MEMSFANSYNLEMFDLPQRDKGAEVAELSSTSQRTAPQAFRLLKISLGIH